MPYIRNLQTGKVGYAPESDMDEVVKAINRGEVEVYSEDDDPPQQPQEPEKQATATPAPTTQPVQPEPTPVPAPTPGPQVPKGSSVLVNRHDYKAKIVPSAQEPRELATGNYVTGQQMADFDKVRKQHIKDLGLDDMNEWESAGRGALQGVTFGTSDELVGLGEGALDALHGKSFKKSYVKHRDESRLANEEAQRQNPVAYDLGEFGGGFLAPVPGSGEINALVKGGGALAKGLAHGAVGGALAGFGHGEGDFADQAKSVGLGLGVGAGFGAAAGGLADVGTGIKKAAITRAAGAEGRNAVNEFFGKPEAQREAIHAPTRRKDLDLQITQQAAEAEGPVNEILRGAEHRKTRAYNRAMMAAGRNKEVIPSEGSTAHQVRNMIENTIEQVDASPGTQRILRRIVGTPDGMPATTPNGDFITDSQVKVQPPQPYDAMLTSKPKEPPVTVTKREFSPITKGDNVKLVWDYRQGLDEALGKLRGSTNPGDRDAYIMVKELRNHVEDILNGTAKDFDKETQQQLMAANKQYRKYRQARDIVERTLMSKAGKDNDSRIVRGDKIERAMRNTSPNLRSAVTGAVDDLNNVYYGDGQHIVVDLPPESVPGSSAPPADMETRPPNPLNPLADIVDRQRELNRVENEWNKLNPPSASKGLMRKAAGKYLPEVETAKRGIVAYNAILEKFQKPSLAAAIKLLVTRFEPRMPGAYSQGRAVIGSIPASVVLSLAKQNKIQRYQDLMNELKSMGIDVSDQ